MNRFLVLIVVGFLVLRIFPRCAFAQGGPQWVLGELTLHDDGGKSIGEFKPIELVETRGPIPPGLAASVEVKNHQLVMRVGAVKRPSQPGTPPFDCTDKPSRVRFRVYYPQENSSLHEYYSRPENALSEDFVVFDETVLLGANDVAEATWDGQISAAVNLSGHRLLVRGDGAAYYMVEASASVCGRFSLIAFSSFTVARPEAWLVGDAYPAAYLDNVEVGNAPVPQGEGILDGFNAPSGMSGTFGLTARRGTLVNLLPEENGYAASAERNSIHHAVLGRWRGSSVFVWVGHSYHGDWLVNYWGAGQAEDPIEQQKDKGAAFSPLRAVRPFEPKLEKAFDRRFYDFPASMENNQLVVLGACWSAKPLNPWPGGPNGDRSMIDVCASRGADVAIGWSGLAHVKIVQEFLKVALDHQATKDPITGKLPSLSDSIDEARRRVGSPLDGTDIRVVLGYLADPKKIHLGDLPSYGLPLNVR